MRPHQIIQRDRLYNLPMKVIEPECMDQFVVGLLNWYQNYEPVCFGEREPPSYLPNTFHLIEYPNKDAEYVLNQFIKSGEIHLLKTKEETDPREARQRSVTVFNNLVTDMYELLFSDIHHVLNAYHLFHYYQDDAQADGIFRNPYITEVW